MLSFSCLACFDIMNIFIDVVIFIADAVIVSSVFAPDIQ